MQARWKQVKAELLKKVAAEKRNTMENTLRQVNSPEEFDETTYTNVHTYGKKTLFRTHKFFTCDETIANYSVEGSPGDLTMKAFGIPDARKAAWWKVYYKAIEEGINYARQTAQTMIGKKLKDKVNAMYLPACPCFLLSLLLVTNTCLPPALLKNYASLVRS